MIFGNLNEQNTLSFLLKLIFVVGVATIFATMLFFLLVTGDNTDATEISYFLGIVDTDYYD